MAGNKKRLLIDHVAWMSATLDESKGEGRIVARGEFARGGVATANKRKYSTPLWERECKRLGPAMSERRVYGELDHPADGRTKLSRASHIMTNLRVEDGVVIGEADIMDTDAGRNLKAILKANGKVGVSSRGYGSTKVNDQGEDVVQEDYKLNTFDFVADPANASSYPEVFYEASSPPTEEVLAEVEELKITKEADVMPKQEEIVDTAALKEAFSRELMNTLQDVRADVRDQVRAELLSDPKVAAALEAVEDIKSVVAPFNLSEEVREIVEAKDEEIKTLQATVAERDAQIVTLDENIADLATAARTMGYKYFLETQLADDPDADLIRTLVGDVVQYDTADELGTKIEAIRTDLASRREKEAAAAAEAAAEANRREQEVSQEKAALESRMGEIEEALTVSTELNRELAVQLYTERRLTNHPKAAKIRKLVESANCQSREAVDAIIATESREVTHDRESASSVRSRVSDLLGGGYGPQPSDEESVDLNESSETTVDYNGLGVSLRELRNLAGTESAS